jgi:ABC-2 type transport system permease protein
VSEPRAVLHDIRYSRFSGTLRPRRSAVASFVASGIRRPLGLRRSASAKIWPFLLLAVAYLPAVAVVAVPLLIPAVDVQPTDLIRYPQLLTTNSVVLLAFVATSIPSMLTRDRRDRVLSLYFATALSWVEYVLGVFLAAASLLAMIVLGPMLVLFFGSIATADAPGTWFTDNVDDLPRIIGAAAIVVLFHTSLGLTIGSLTSRRVFAVGGYLAVVLVGPALTGVLTLVTGDEWPLSLDPASGPVRLGMSFVGLEIADPGPLAWVVWVVVVVGGLGVLAGRYAKGSDA